MELHAATTLLTQRIAEHTHDHQHAPAEQLLVLYAEVRDGLGPIPDTTLDYLFSRFIDAERADDAAQLTARTAPWGSPGMEAEASVSATAFFTAATEALASAGHTGDAPAFHHITDPLDTAH